MKAKDFKIGQTIYEVSNRRYGNEQTTKPGVEKVIVAVGSKYVYTIEERYKDSYERNPQMARRFQPSTMKNTDSDTSIYLSEGNYEDNQKASKQSRQIRILLESNSRRMIDEKLMKMIDEFYNDLVEAEYI